MASRSILMFAQEKPYYEEVTPPLGTMPSTATRRMYQNQIPSFMSVFDLDAEIMADRETVTIVDHQMIDQDTKAPVLASPSQQEDLDPAIILPDASHRHHDSTSTTMSESAESSPTTTFSTTDSSPLSGPSPSSFPNSPMCLVPLSNSYPSTSFGWQHNHGTMLSIPEAGALERPMTSPASRRPRNMKGLSIQPPVVLPATSKTFSTEPASPSFVKPRMPAMRRKPSQLSLRTSTSDLIAKTSIEVPASPAMPPILQRRALKHSASSPHMLAALKSSTFGPPGGMTFPKVLERNESGLSEVLRPMKSSMKTEFDATITGEEWPIKTQLANRADYGPYHENMNNEDHKSPGYPDGPLSIYDDNVFLYSEPTAEEASRFDVIINVAQEVKNPFDAPQKWQQEVGLSSQPTLPDKGLVSDTALTVASFATAFERRPPKDGPVDTPTTPRANPLDRPEYIHVPWDHNSDILPDLMGLCEIIENRTKEGKKVLVHCQQGASRSASLIIAYGLYQNPELSVNDAYYAAQAKSRWISPNMKLMYSLQDFHKELSKRRLPPTPAYRPIAGRSSSKHRLTLSADSIDRAPKEPHTAPLPGERGEVSHGDSNHGPPRARGNSISGIQAVSPGPVSAPLTCPWRERVEGKAPASAPGPELDQTPQPPQSNLAGVEPSLGSSGQACTRPAQQVAETLTSRPSPCPQDVLVKRTVAFASTYLGNEALVSPRAEAMTNNPLHGFSRVAGMRFVEPPPAPTGALFSPRKSMFPPDPFSFSGRLTAFGRPPQLADPRSPPKIGEAPIIRSIDDML